MHQCFQIAKLFFATSPIGKSVELSYFGRRTIVGLIQLLKKKVNQGEGRYQQSGSFIFVAKVLFRAE